MNKKITSYQTAEFGKFIELDETSMYPPVSVIRWSFPDNSNAFPENSEVPPISSIEIYSKYAVLVQPVGLMEQLTTITNVLCAILNK
jgi:hypothetical protein